MQQLINNILLYKFGVECEGRVLLKFKETRKNRKGDTTTTYHITIRIKYEDELSANLLPQDREEKEVRVLEGQYRKYNEGDTVRYMYLKSYPQWDKIDDIQHRSCVGEICSCCITDTILNVICWFIVYNGLGATFLWAASLFGGYICILIAIAWCAFFMCLCNGICFIPGIANTANPELNQGDENNETDI